MAAMLSSKVIALVALLAVYAASYAEAGGWLPAKATWYGQPNGSNWYGSNWYGSNWYGAWE